MGLDILTYDKDGERIGIIDFDEELHQMIFSQNDIDREEKHFLALISDYYKANETYEGEDLEAFVSELEEVRDFVQRDSRYKLDVLTRSLSSKEIYKIRVTGD
jgi:hypothetical protein